MQRSLAERLRLLRARNGLSLLAASEQLGVDRHTLRDLELGQGRTPRYPTLAKIAEGYGVDVEELLEEPVPLAEGSQLDADIKRQGAVAQRSMEEYGATPESLKDPQKRARMDKDFETLKELRWLRYELMGVPEPLATIVERLDEQTEIIYRGTPSDEERARLRAQYPGAKETFKAKVTEVMSAQANS